MNPAHLTTRAAAHGLPAEMLTPDQRFQGVVDDLLMAALLRALDSGVRVHQGGPYHWTAPEDAPMGQARLGRTVGEALRTGLARALSMPTGPQIREVVVLPAPVHLRAPWLPQGPRCRPGWCPGGPLRWRLVDDRTLVDCQDCLAAAY